MHKITLEFKIRGEFEINFELVSGLQASKLLNSK